MKKLAMAGLATLILSYSAQSADSLFSNSTGFPVKLPDISDSIDSYAESFDKIDLDARFLFSLRNGGDLEFNHFKDYFSLNNSNFVYGNVMNLLDDIKNYSGKFFFEQKSDEFEYSLYAGHLIDVPKQDVFKIRFKLRHIMSAVYNLANFNSFSGEELNKFNKNFYRTNYIMTLSLWPDATAGAGYGQVRDSYGSFSLGD